MFITSSVPVEQLVERLLLSELSLVTTASLNVAKVTEVLIQLVLACCPVTVLDLEILILIYNKFRMYFKN